MAPYMRDVNIGNADRLKRMQGITVLESSRGIEAVVKRHIEGIGGRSAQFFSLWTDQSCMGETSENGWRKKRRV